ncbi:alpha/beta hydrolase [Rhodococcoides yunnanense]|uniref:alpha/beta hydrolase n=1 Tax=Rhodococcoides yunnanense TaxID=278209 RepID=UPI0009342C4F|nr:alpha/beta hydrolase [Rhodococcus yunnanensis]
MTRDADAEALVAGMRRAGVPALHELGLDGARQYLSAAASAGRPGPELEHVSDHDIPVGERVTRARVYRPTSATPLPTVVYAHGGGFVLGTLAASDAFCRRLADAARCLVISVDYSLAPESPFPAAIDDVVAALHWAAANAARWNGDPGRLVALGDSAGGGLVTVAVRKTLGSGPTVTRQILAYPGVDLTGLTAGTDPHPYGTELPLTDPDRAWFRGLYVTEESMASDPDAAPLLGDVTGMPPTTVLLGGCDPLSDEGLAYAQHLWRAGVSVDLHFYAGQIHGFLTLDDAILPRASEALGVVSIAIANS